jgi:hypothetical protein
MRNKEAETLDRASYEELKELLLLDSPSKYALNLKRSLTAEHNSGSARVRLHKPRTQNQAITGAT